MASPSLPLISVIIPAYNQAAFLADSLASVQNQTYSHLDIVVINDGSTDETESICQTFASLDPRIRYKNQPNQGPAAARNRGIAEAQGIFICLLDSDDLMNPRRIELQLRAFLEDPSIDIVYTALQIIDQADQPIGEMHSQDYPPQNFLAHLFFRNVLPGPSTIMAKRTCLVEHPYNEAFVHAEDYELMIRLAHLYRFKYLDIALTSYRRHRENLSNNLAAHRKAELAVLHQYGQAHIESIVDGTTLNEEEKNLLKGKIFFNQEHFALALSFFQPLSTALALFYKGNCYVKLNQGDKALQAYEKACQLDSYNAACQNNLGILYAKRGLMSLAQRCFDQALQLKPGYLDAAYNRAHLEKLGTLRFTWRELRQELLPYPLNPC